MIVIANTPYQKADGLPKKVGTAMNSGSGPGVAFDEDSAPKPP